MVYLKICFRGIKMELHKDNNMIIINNDSKRLKILNDSDINIWIIGDKRENKLPGTSIKITEYDGKVYQIFNKFYNSLVEEYNGFKEYNDFAYEEYPLYNSEHNWFTFYDDYSTVDDKNIFRIIKNQHNDPHTIGIYIRNKNNRLQAHTVAKSGSKYPQFVQYFSHLITDLQKLESEKTYTKKKEV